MDRYFTVRIKLGNLAMDNPYDVADALANITNALHAGKYDGEVNDYNGNRVGDWWGEFLDEPDNLDDFGNGSDEV